MDCEEIKSDKVLIESDWNLKQDFIYNTLSETSINRIRLEFKVS